MPQTTSLITSKLDRARAQLPYLPRALNLVWTAARGWTTAWIALLLIQGLLPAAIVTLTKVLVDSLVTAIDAGRTWYYDWLMTQREAASEIRLFDAGAHFSDSLQSVRARLRGERLAIAINNLRPS